MGRIMVVDDDIDILKFCDSVLTPHGHEVVMCTDPNEAIQILRKHPVELLIVDIVMPTATGFDMLRTLRKIDGLKLPPVLMATRRRAVQDIKTALELGATDYMIKPIEKDVLVTKVASLLGKQTSVPSIKFATGAANSAAVIPIQALVTTVSEMGMTILTNIMLDRNMRIQVQTPVFEEIGISAPPLRVTGGRTLDASQDDRYKYEIFISFIGLDDPVMQKIRRWISSKTIAANKQQT